MSRSRTWCYTLNNYTQEEEEQLQAVECTYHVYGHEQGEEGTPHLQGYIAHSTMKSLKQMKAISPRAHWEAAKGDAESNFAYCTKEDDSSYYQTGNKTFTAK